ncbi:LysR family transcriptional regulator [Methylophaga sp. OBS4]|uniref:LysR family transcriptional regulator n=1 Tax=Methylophaga sp. OBS4 TaxID=2991935 RepID=UPI0022590558|nr:LysR family transcriptional regulator [Methylophaga sp. OBS4]MCX4186982.1 LysR family transcriptional regulator [Methylophaga sp. OBS4]
MIHATLQQFRLFEAVARLKNFTRAAEEVHLTQPAVSIQIKRLEENIGTPLLEQVGKQLHLTVAGQEVYDACRDVLQRLHELDSSLDDLKDEVAGPVNLVVVSSAKYFLPYLLGNFLERYPKVKPRLMVTNRAQLLSRLSANEDHLYIMGQVPDELPVEEYPFLENVLVIVARPDHPLCNKKNISLAEIAREHIVGREPGSGTRKAIEELFADAGLSVSPYIEMSGADEIKHAVMAGLGIAILSMHSLQLELAANKLKILDVEQFPLHRRWYAVHRKGKKLSKAAQTFLDYLQQEGEAEIAHVLNSES